MTVLVSAFVCLLAAVAVPRFRFKFRTSILLMILVVQMVPLEVLVIALFLQVKSLGLLNSILGLMIVYVAFGSWMLRGFVQAIPVEFEEAAYRRRELVADVSLRAAAPGHTRPRRDERVQLITAWYEFIFAMAILGGAKDQCTVAIGLKSFFGEHANDWGSIMAADIPHRRRKVKDRAGHVVKSDV